MTTAAADPVAVAASGAGSQRGSLLRAEISRFGARRFIRALLVLAVVGYVVATVTIALTQFAKPTAAGLADAQHRLDNAVAQQNLDRDRCLADPSRPANVPAGDACGPEATRANYRIQDFMIKQPFLLARYLPNGALAVGAGTAVLMFLVGATYVGAEWSTRSMVALLFWEPRRLRVMAVKLGVTALAAALVGALMQAVWLGTAQVIARTRGSTASLPAHFWGDLAGQQARTVLLVILAAIFGFAIANLMRNTAAALGVGFVYFAIAETAVRAFHQSWEQWLLTDNAGAVDERRHQTLSYRDLHRRARPLPLRRARARP